MSDTDLVSTQPLGRRPATMMDLVPFDPTHAATVATWAQTPNESLHWCSEYPVTPETITTWSTTTNDVQAYVLMNNKKPIAYGELWLEEDETELARLIVAPPHRNQGVGNHLVTALTNIALTRTPELIALRVHPNNSRAAHLYQRAGFHPVDAPTAAEWNTHQPVTYQWLTFTRPKATP